MYEWKTMNNRGGFALPTVLIASVVMLTILAISVSSVATIRTALKAQYYEQLAKTAGEAGVAYAKACLAQSGNVPLWTDTKPLTPATDCAGNVVLSPAVQILVAAGGGGGGGSLGGGGGGGGVVANEAYAVTPKQYNIQVGNGGSAGNAGGTAGNNGGNSSITPASGPEVAVTAIGGGGGGARQGADSAAPAKNGGSGGGGGGTLTSAGGLPAQGGTGTSGQGFAGGAASSGPSMANAGGGGGAGGPGGAATGTASGQGVSGNGGTGLLSYISGEASYYGAGGSGGRWGTGQVGLPGRLYAGIGGNADTIEGSASLANTGAGGGGGALSAAGGVGGSGVVVVRIPKPSSPGANITISSASGNYIVNTSGAYQTYTFRSGSGNFVVSAASSGSCPYDPRCSVVSEAGLRSSFSIKRPTLNNEGKAVAIANTGYVELLRSSTGEVWRTYRQPTVQPAVVPDFCSSSTQDGLGWSYAARTTPQQTIPGPTGNGAASISLNNAPIYPGQVYYRKDFVVTTPGIYTLRANTPSSSNLAEFYINGNLVARAEGSLTTGAVNLGVGCYTIMGRVTNKSVAPAEANFVASLALQNAAPIVVSDTSWRVAAGTPVHFSAGDFYESTDTWSTVTPAYGSATAGQETQGGQPAETTRSGWSAATGDIYTHTLVACDSGDRVNSRCNPDRWSYLRANEDIVLSSETNVTVSGFCAKSCDLYLGGTKVLSASDTNLQQQTLTLAAGTYRFAARVFHGTGGSPLASYIGASVKDSTGTVLSRTDYSWRVSKDAYETTAAIEPYTYEASFMPSPVMFPPTFDAVVVGGGGGGGANAAGGGGGGGVLSLKALEAATSNRSITIGGGGSGAATTSTIGGTGGATTFGSYTVPGGGGGASRDGGTAPSVGATGGGGSGTTASGANIRNIGALGTLGYGWAGGNGTPSDQGVASKGGGGGGATNAGAAAINTIGGRGGSGYIMYVNNATRRAFGGGGGGGVTASNGTPGAATDGGVSAIVSGTPSAAAANSAGGGGGGSSGAAGGAGGSGVVVIRYRTAAFTAARLAATGGTKLVDTITGYTYHVINSNDSFAITTF